MSTKHKYDEVKTLAEINNQDDSGLIVVIRLMRHVDNGEFFVDIRKARENKDGSRYLLRGLGITVPVSNIDVIAETMNAVAAAVKLSI